jgi:hypothetical protein
MGNFDGSTIKYDFNQNHQFLDTLNNGLNDAMALQAEVNNVFKILYSVYEGDGALALQAAHQNIADLMDMAVSDMADVNRRAREQQETMAAMDRANAAEF